MIKESTNCALEKVYNLIIIVIIFQFVTDCHLATTCNLMMLLLHQVLSWSHIKMIFLLEYFDRLRQLA